VNAHAVRLGELKRPPIGEIGVVALGLVATTLVYLASHLPGKPTTMPAYVMLAIATLLIAGSSLLLRRLDNFSWRAFRQVAGWALLAYVVIGGMLEFVFLRNHTRGEELALLTWALVLFVLDVPLLLGFGVARYQQP
jgi:hypothetical protein